MANRPAGGTPQPLVYHLTISGANEDHARTGDLDITRGYLTIACMFSNVTIDASGLGDRVFQIFPHAQLTLVNLNIQGGSAPSFPKLDNVPDGGAIRNAGTLILEHCIITNNICGDGGNGGGIKNEGTCILSDSIISRNQSGDGSYPLGFAGDGGNGGGLYNSGTMVLNQCVVSANSAGQGNDGVMPPDWYNLPPGIPGWNGGNGGSGGGIYNIGKLKLKNCTITANHCGDGGSGSAGYHWSGGNGGDGGNGGGIYYVGNSSVILSCTIGSNQAGAAGNGGDGNPPGASGFPGTGPNIFGLIPSP